MQYNIGVYTHICVQAALNLLKDIDINLTAS